MRQRSFIFNRWFDGGFALSRTISQDGHKEV